MPCNSANSIGNSSRFHSAISAVLLSAIRSAFTCSGDNPRATCTGTSDSPSDFAALSRVCPMMITPASSTTIGCRKPNSRIDFATTSTASSLRRGFLSYGCGRSMGQVSMVMAVAIMACP